MGFRLFTSDTIQKMASWLAFRIGEWRKRVRRREVIQSYLMLYSEGHIPDHNYTLADIEFDLFGEVIGFRSKSQMYMPWR